MENFILIVGFTKRTSFSAAKALLKKGYTVAISDTISNDEKLALLSELGPAKNVINLLGNQDVSILDKYNFNLIMPSPGVPLYIPLLAEAKKRGIEIMGDIELFYRMFPDNMYIGITGTDGKTTTTTLVYEIIKKERDAVAGGNIGMPVFEYYDRIKKGTVIILELSSFQLEAVKDFRPRIAAVLNIAEDHLDRYPSIKEYMLAKKNIFGRMDKNDIAVLNNKSLFLSELKEGVKPEIKEFGYESPCEVYFDGKAIIYKGDHYIDRDKIKIKGVHNVENAMAAILIAKSAGITDNAIKETLVEFAGVEHRIEFVRNIGGADYYNDSKATTVNALEKALMSFSQPVILIAGGRDKGLDFTKIKSLAAQRLKHLVLIGEATDKIEKELAFNPIYKASDMKEAVVFSKSISKKGDVVLLSPGCASFDMFKNYEERGRVFKDIVNGL